MAEEINMFPHHKRQHHWSLVFLATLSVAAGGTADRRVADAVEQHNGEHVRALVAQHVNVNVPQADGTTALHWATYSDDLETTDLLIRAGARVNAANDLGVTPLSLACGNANAAVIARLLDAGADSNLALPSGETPLMTCARTGSVEAVTALLTHGADVNREESELQQTALMWAASEGHTAIVRTLVDQGSNVHARSKSGFTPLLFAAREGHQEVARLLLAAGAKANDAADDGSSALLIATVRGQVALAQMLLEYGANPNAAGIGYTPLHWAAGSWETELTGPRGIAAGRDKEWRALRGIPTGKVELITSMLAHGADPNARVVKPPARYGFSSFQGYQRTFLVGATPFLLAAMAADVDVMHALVTAGADPRLPTKENTTPLMVAAGLGRILQESRLTSSESIESVRLAWELGNDVNAVNDAGNTALHGAAHIRSDEVVQFLADKGARLSVRNKPANFLLFDLPAETPLQISERTVQPGQAPFHVRTSTGDLLRKLGATE